MVYVSNLLQKNLAFPQDNVNVLFILEWSE